MSPEAQVSSQLPVERFASLSYTAPKLPASFSIMAFAAAEFALATLISLARRHRERNIAQHRQRALMVLSVAKVVILLVGILTPRSRTAGPTSRAQRRSLTAR